MAEHKDEHGWVWVEDPDGDHVAFRALDGSWPDGAIDVDRITQGRSHFYVHGQPDRLGRGTIVRLRLNDAVVKQADWIDRLAEALAKVGAVVYVRLPAEDPSLCVHGIRMADVCSDCAQSRTTAVQDDTEVSL